MRNTEPTFIGIRNHWTANLNNEVFPRVSGSLTSTAPVLLGTAGDYGAVVMDILVTPSGSISANNVRFFTMAAGATVVQPSIGFAIAAFNDSSQAATAPYYLLSAQSNANNNNKPFPQLLMLADGRGIPLAPNESLYVGLGIAEPTASKIHVSAWVGDYAAPT